MQGRKRLFIATYIFPKRHLPYNAYIMQFRSKSSFQTLKTIPNGSENRATGLLIQAGYIRQEMA